MKRTAKEIVKRYFLFMLGLVFVSFGIAFTTSSRLGTSPISAIPYSLSFILPALTIGNWTILFSVLLILLQIPFLKKKTKPVEVILEIGMSFVFGYVIDFAVWCLSGLGVDPQAYWLRIACLLIGCVLIAVGVFLQVTADVIMLPGDALCRAIAYASKKQFGTVRMISDISMALVAALLCLLFLHRLAGVREGTLIAALLVGNLTKLIKKLFSPLVKKLFPAEE